MDPASSSAHNIMTGHHSVKAHGEHELPEREIASSHLDPTISSFTDVPQPSDSEEAEQCRAKVVSTSRGIPLPPPGNEKQGLDTIESAFSPSDDRSRAIPPQQPTPENLLSSRDSRRKVRKHLGSTPSPSGNQRIGLKRGKMVSSSRPSRLSPPTRPVPSDFVQRVKKLVKLLPHLNILLEGGTIQSGKITIMDYFSDQQPRCKQVKTFESLHGFDPQEFQHSIKDQPSKAHARFIMVEDITSEFMSALDSAFTLDPEMFAEHLIKSKYGYGRNKDTDLSDSDPATWISLSKKKSFISLRWFRPIHRKTDQIPLDRLNELRKSAHAWWEDQGEYSGGAEGERMIYEVERQSNISRRERHLSAVPDRLLQLEKKPIPASLEERVTICRTADEGQDITVLLLDPLPLLSRSKRPKTSEAGEQETIRPFDHIYPRSPPPKASLCEQWGESDYDSVKKFLGQTRTTSKDIQLWLTNPEIEEHYNNAEAVIAALLQVVSNDMDNFLRLLSVALSEIALGSSDDAKMQELLAHWRDFIKSYQAELPDIKQSLDNFRKWVSPGNQVTPITRLVEDLTGRFNKLIEQTEKAHEALRAEMSILESKRGIAEAEGVAKLTELAFVYIPLTFAASLFSMQVRELQEPAPLSAFITTCIILTCTSYGVRLLIRSTPVVKRRRTWGNDIRKEPGTEERIPTHIFVKWALHKMWNHVSSLAVKVVESVLHQRPFTALIFALGCLVPTITLFWVNTQLDVGFKAAITILLTGIVSVASLLPMFGGRLGYAVRSILDIFPLYRYGRRRFSSPDSV